METYKWEDAKVVVRKVLQEEEKKTKEVEVAE